MGTHVPMFVPKFGLMKPGQTSVPNSLSPTMGFLNENDSLAYYAILGELSPGLSFTIGFFKAFLDLRKVHSTPKHQLRFYPTREHFPPLNAK